MYTSTGVTYFSIDVVLATGNWWRVLRRYRDFDTLRDMIVRQAPDLSRLPFPRKHFTGCTGNRLEKRRLALEAWLQTLIRSPHAGRMSASLRPFLETGRVPIPDSEMQRYHGARPAPRLVGQQMEGFARVPASAVGKVVPFTVPSGQKFKLLIPVGTLPDSTLHMSFNPQTGKLLCDIQPPSRANHGFSTTPPEAPAMQARAEPGPASQTQPVVQPMISQALGAGEARPMHFEQGPPTAMRSALPMTLPECKEMDAPESGQMPLEAQPVAEQGLMEDEPEKPQIHFDEVPPADSLDVADGPETPEEQACAVEQTMSDVSAPAEPTSFWQECGSEGGEPVDLVSTEWTHLEVPVETPEAHAEMPQVV